MHIGWVVCVNNDKKNAQLCEGALTMLTCSELFIVVLYSITLTLTLIGALYYQSRQAKGEKIPERIAESETISPEFKRHLQAAS